MAGKCEPGDGWGASSRAIRRTAVLVCVSIASLFLTDKTVSAQGLGVTGNLVGMFDGSRVLEVQTVFPGGLASQIGIIRGDSIISINGLAPGDALTNQQAIARGGGRISVVVQRFGRQLVLGNGQLGGIGIPRIGSPLGSSGLPLGTGANRFRLTPGQQGPNLQITLRASQLGGVQVTSVVKGGVGDQLLFQAGDVITSVNNVPVNTTAEFFRSYVVNNRGQIVMDVVRRGRRGTITVSEQALRRAASRGGGGRGVGRPPARPIQAQLELSTFFDRKRQVTVAGGAADGLGRRLGIAERGTRIVSINGQAISTPNDVKRVDDEIAAGRVTRLVINVIRANGTRATVSFPQ